MTDIHSHIIPGIDDGSPDMESSLQMLWMAAESGVKRIVATSHCNIPGMFDNFASDDLILRVKELQDTAKSEEIPIRIAPGMEVFATEDLPDLIRKKKVWTLNGTKYFLMEFSFDEDPDFCFYILRKVRNLGYIPVIAHPERYYFIQEDPQLAFEWCVDGSVLQLNKGSVLGRFGEGPERTAHALIEHGLAACVASDAHSPYSRTTDMRELRHVLRSRFGEEPMKLLLEENPLRIVRGLSLLGYEPTPFY